MIGGLQDLACFAALFSGVQLLLDVLRGPLPTHIARRRLPIRALDNEMVLLNWLVRSGRVNPYLCGG